MLTIRSYNESQDFSMLESWWLHNNTKIWKTALPKESTFIAEYNNKPIASICIYLMNSPDAAMVENLIGNPDPELKEHRKEAVDLLFKHVEEVAKSLGYTTLVLFSYEDKLKDRYSNLGYTKTLENVTTFSKKI